MNKNTRILASVALSSTLLAGIAAPSMAATAKKAPTTLTIAATAITSFATDNSVFANAAPYYQAVYDTLLRAKPDGTLIPGLATKWSYNADQTVLTLTLHKGIKFTDGTPFDANAVVANMKRAMASPKTSMADFNFVQDVTAKNATTVVVTLTDNDPAFLTNLAWNDGLEESPKSFGTADEATTPVGTGPYILNKSKTVSGSVYTFDSNPKYWDPKNRHFDNLVIKVISDSTALVNALTSGQVDAIKVGSNDAVSSLQSAGFAMTPNALDLAGFHFLDKGGKQGSPVAKQKVRQAINMAMNRPAILQALGAGYGSVTEQIFSPSSKAYDKSLNDTYSYDVAGAKKLLADAGYPNGFTMNVAALPYYGTNVYAVLTDALSAIGITVKEDDFAITQAAAYMTALQSGKYQMFYANLEMNANYWKSINFWLAPDATWNKEGFLDATSQKLIGKIQGASAAAIPGLLKQLNKYIVTQAWYVPLYVKQINYAHTKKINVPAQSGNSVPFLYNITPAK